MLSLWGAAVLTLGLTEAPWGAHAQVRGPLVVVGLGGSGTGSIKRTVQNFGVAMCNYTAICGAKGCPSIMMPAMILQMWRWKGKPPHVKLPPTPKEAKRRNDGLGNQDNLLTMQTHRFIDELLNASDGHISVGKDYQKTRFFQRAVRTELRMAMLTRECSLQQWRQMTKTPEGATPPASFPWGYKNPHHLYLLPVMDRAFNRTQRVLGVVRDPRDICSGDNNMQFQLYDHWVARRRKNEFESDSERECFKFWADVWGDVLQEYGKDPLFRVVRIEDLVMPDPQQEGNSARKVLECVLRHAGVPMPMPEKALSWLNLMHNHTDSYAGNRKPKAEKSRLEHVTTQIGGNFQNMMELLGYRTDRYELLAPKASTVCV